MRLNRKCRRTLRDERAGLTFRWRLAHASPVRTLVAVAIAAVLFGGASSLFELKGKDVRQVRTNPVRLRVLNLEDEGSRALLDWARQHSPFPDRWEPEVDRALRDQLVSLEESLAQRTRYRPLLRPLPEKAKERGLPELFDPMRPRLPPVERKMETLAGISPLNVLVYSEAGGVLARRWETAPVTLRELRGDPKPGEKEIRPEELLGFERTFLVRVDPAGAVVFCQSLEPLESELNGVLERWLRRQRAKADPQARGMVWGKIRISVRNGEGSATPPEGGGKAP